MNPLLRPPHLWRSSLWPSVFWIGVLALCPGHRVRAAATEETNALWLAEHYTKYEHRIPMRDGVRLFTRVYVPKDAGQAWPILLTRTPYALKPYGADNYSSLSASFRTLARDRFILVTQDVRGRYGSEGEFVHVRPFRADKGPQEADENSDTWDTIDWLVRRVPGNNGRVGMLGISYPGFYTAMGMIDSHPALKAASPQAPIADWFMGDDLHHNGAFFLSQNFDFFYRFAQRRADPLREAIEPFHFGTPDGYDYFLRLGPLANTDAAAFKGRVPEWKEFLAHPTYDAWWQARNLRPHLKNVRCAVMTVGGWFDAEDLFGPLEVYRWTERLNPGITNLLVMGPWSHGQWSRDSGESLGPVRFQAATAQHYREQIELPFFRHYLKDDTNFVPTEARIFETGTHRWRRFAAWPPPEARPRQLFLRAGGALAFAAPADENAFDEWVSDPAKPVPFTATPTTGYPHSYPVEDQRFVASRPDVVVYETAPLEEDLILGGPVGVTLHVATTGTDADWVVKLIDVYPGDFPSPEPNPAGLKMGGYQQLVRGDVFRGRFRRSFEQPEAMVPGERTRIEFTMPDVAHAFRRGHRVMVQVQSTWYPLVDRNPQTYVNIASARAEDYRRATQRVFRSREAASALTVQVLPP